MGLPLLRIAFVLGAAGLLLSACSTAPPRGVEPVHGFDLQRYLGKWYEIARLDHRFERGLTDVTATYTPHGDGSIEVLNRGYNPRKSAYEDARGVARFTGDSKTASLKVSFFGPFYGGYHVVALDPDYRWAMVVGNDRSYLWILSRTRTLPDDVKAQLLAQAQNLGFDTDKLTWVSQTRTDN